MIGGAGQKLTFAEVASAGDCSLLGSLGLTLLVTVWRPDPERGCLGPAASVWVLDFIQERLHNMNPGDCEGVFIRAGDSETREGFT